MKKQNRNICAYLRQSNLQHGQQLLMNSNENVSKMDSNQNMCRQIVSEMDPQITKYLNKLVCQNEKEGDKRKSVQKLLNHQRAKSYADILVGSPTNSKNLGDKGHSHRGSHPCSQLNSILFSLSCTPSSQKTGNTKMKMRNGGQNSQFLQSIDSYISDLTVTKSTGSYRQQISNDEMIQRRTVQKSKEKNHNNLKLVQKLQNALKKQKELYLKNHILQKENKKKQKKIERIKKKYSIIVNQLFNYIKKIQDNLIKIKKQKYQLEQNIHNFQQKFSMLRSERKTLGIRPHINQQYFMESQTTEQDNTEFIISPYQQLQQTKFKNKSLKRISFPRSTAKQSRVSGTHMGQLSTMLANKNLEFDDDSSQNEQN